MVSFGRDTEMRLVSKPDTEPIQWLYRQAGKRQTSGQGSHLVPAAMPGGLMGLRCTSATPVEVVAEG